MTIARNFKTPNWKKDGINIRSWDEKKRQRRKHKQKDGYQKKNYNFNRIMEKGTNYHYTHVCDKRTFVKRM